MCSTGRVSCFGRALDPRRNTTGVDHDRHAVAPRTLARRLLPLQIGTLQGLILWVPIEKLFMTQIGFDAASVGAMAAAYAAVVPLLEVPSGILADRWSRSRLMVLACVALMVSSLLGGLSET